MRIKSFLGLSFALAKAEFKLRNEGSYLGILWYLLGPILMFLILTAVFSTRLGNNIPNYPLYLFLGIIMFNFFQFATTESVRSLATHRGIIKSIKFPLEALTGAITLKSLFSHLFEIVMFIILLLIFGVSLKGLLFYPLILGIFSIFILGISLLFSSISAYFADFENIWVFASRVLWFITPIFYEIAGQSKLFSLNFLNPMYYFITLARDVMIYSKMPPYWLLAGIFIYTLLALVLGFLIFTKLKTKFAEKI